MIDRGWNLAAKLIWHRPISRKDLIKRNTGFIKDWEYCYHFTKNPHNYYFDNKSNRLWTKSVFSFQDSQVNTNEFDSGFPQELIEIAIKTTVPKTGGTILDPMAGTGVTGVVAKKLGKSFVMIDIDMSKCYGMSSRLSCELKEGFLH
jgi:DNA modification methylase